MDFMNPPLVVLPAHVGALGLGFGLLPLLLFRAKTALFIAADAPVRVEPFENELRGSSANRIRFVYPDPQSLSLFHQALNACQLLHHSGGIDGFGQFQRTTQIEPLDDLADADAFEVFVVDLAYRGPDDFLRHGIAALQLAFIFELELAGD